MISRQRRSYAYVSVWATMAAEEIDAVSLRQRMEALPVACRAYPIHCISFQLSLRVEDFRVRATAFVADHFAPNLSKKGNVLNTFPFCILPKAGFTRLYYRIIRSRSWNDGPSWVVRHVGVHRWCHPTPFFVR